MVMQTPEEIKADTQKQIVSGLTQSLKDKQVVKINDLNNRRTGLLSELTYVDAQIASEQEVADALEAEYPTPKA